MSRTPLRVMASMALVACSGLPSIGPRAAAKRIAPFRAALAVRWGPGAGSDAFREDLQRSMAATLATGCFEGVVVTEGDPEDSGAAVVLAVVLSDVVDETRFDDSIAGTLQPGEPAKELRRVARFEVAVDATLSARASGARIHRKHFVAHVERRPVYVGEDPQAEARAEVTRDIVLNVARTLGCGGAKLERKIRDAFGSATPTTPAPR